jgi:hypothetical protein
MKTGLTAAEAEAACEPYTLREVVPKSDGRQLEPTPGWCERAMEELRGVRCHDRRCVLIAEYEAAQQPALAENSAKEPAPHITGHERDDSWGVRYQDGIFLWLCKWCGGVVPQVDFDPRFRIECCARVPKTEEPHAEPLGHEIVSSHGYFGTHCKRCQRIVNPGDTWMRDSCSARAPKPVPEKADDLPELPEAISRDLDSFALEFGTLSRRELIEMQRRHIAFSSPNVAAWRGGTTRNRETPTSFPTRSSASSRPPRLSR